MRSGGRFPPRQWRRPFARQHPRRFLSLSARSAVLRLLPVLAFVALAAPAFFHFHLARVHQLRQRKCGWLESPPMVCAHGGDSINSAPNTVDAYQSAIRSHVDCMEIDVSRSFDGVLFALHDRDLQRMSSNTTAKVGHLSKKEIKDLDAGFGQQKRMQGQHVPMIEEALSVVSESVKQVILDAKTGPPLFERDMAKDILSVVKRTNCRNCLVWAKSDILVRDVLELSRDVEVGYIVMNDPSTGRRSNLLRMKDAHVAGVYHPLIDERLVKTLHGRGKKAYAWTVDDETSMRRMLQERVDAIITGNPSLLQDLMERMKIECMEEGFRLP